MTQNAPAGSRTPPDEPHFVKDLIEERLGPRQVTALGRRLVEEYNLPEQMTRKLNGRMGHYHRQFLDLAYAMSTVLGVPLREVVEAFANDEGMTVDELDELDRVILRRAQKLNEEQKGYVAEILRIFGKSHGVIDDK